jgi:hypothetical protein
MNNRLSLDHGPDTLARLGTLCLLAGVGGLLLAGLARFGDLPPLLIRIWLRAGLLWVGLSLFLSICGGMLLWRSGHATAAWRPAKPGPRFQAAVLYTREDCPLCEEGRGVLSRYRHYLPPIVEVDVDEDPELAQRFGSCVPVVELDGKVRFRGRISEPLLRRLIDGAPPVDGSQRIIRGRDDSRSD